MSRYRVLLKDNNVNQIESAYDPEIREDGTLCFYNGEPVHLIAAYSAAAWNIFTKMEDKPE
jgi:hypothetical protein